MLGQTHKTKQLVEKDFQSILLLTGMDSGYFLKKEVYHLLFSMNGYQATIINSFHAESVGTRVSRWIKMLRQLASFCHGRFEGLGVVAHVTGDFLERPAFRIIIFELDVDFKIRFGHVDQALMPHFVCLFFHLLA